MFDLSADDLALHQMCCPGGSPRCLTEGTLKECVVGAIRHDLAAIKRGRVAVYK